MNINYNKCQPPPPSMASSTLWLIQSSGSAPSWSASQASIIMWLLPGSCNLTLLLDIWQFLIQGDKRQRQRQRYLQRHRQGQGQGHYVAPSWQLQVDLVARYMAVLNSRWQSERQRQRSWQRQRQRQRHSLGPGNCCLTFLLDMAIFNSYQSMRCFFKSQHFYFPIIICSLNIELRGMRLRNIEDMSMAKITIDN